MPAVVRDGEGRESGGEGRCGAGGSLEGAETRGRQRTAASSRMKIKVYGKKSSSSIRPVSLNFIYVPIYLSVPNGQDNLLHIFRGFLLKEQL